MRANKSMPTVRKAMPATIISLVPTRFTSREPRVKTAMMVKVMGRKARPVTSGE